MHLTILITILSAGIVQTMSAQSLDPSILSPAGDFNSTEHLQLEWTLGELAIEGTTHQHHSYTEGFHQPLLTVTPSLPNSNTASNSPDEWNTAVIVAPNPVATTLMIQMNKPGISDLQWTLTNPEGQLIQYQTLRAGDTQQEIDLSSLSSGMYYLQIQSKDGQTQHVYKISKIQ